MINRKEWIVFDAMGVVYPVSDDVNDLLWPYVQEKLPQVNRQAFIDAYVRASVGRYSPQQFWEAIGLGKAYPQIERDYLNTKLTIDPGFKAAAQSLAERYHIGMLSNDIGDWSRFLRKRFGLDFFETAVISGDVLCRKPYPEIFELFLTQSGADAENCVFVDDRKKNLEVAASLGFKTVWFHRFEDVRAYMPDAEIASFDMLEKAIRAIGF